MAMTDEQRETIAKVYAMQLKGIMFHFDMSLLYRLCGMMALSRKHYRQAMEETATHATTEYAIIDTCGEIVRPEVDSTRVRITNSLIRTKPSPEEITKLHEQAVKAWKAWEQGVLLEYEKAETVFPHPIWHRLIAKVQKELKLIK